MMLGHCWPLRRQRLRQICVTFLPSGRSQRFEGHVCSLCGFHSHAIDVKAQGSSGLPRWLWHQRGAVGTQTGPRHSHTKKIWFTGEITKGAATGPPCPQVWCLISRHTCFHRALWLLDGSWMVLLGTQGRSSNDFMNSFLLLVYFNLFSSSVCSWR